MDTLAMSKEMDRPSRGPLPARTNRELLMAYRRGDRTSAELLVDRTYQAVYAAAFKLCRDPSRADDLTQETYRKAWQSLDRFEGRCKVSTWLYRIAYTTFLNSVRSSGREAPLEDALIEVEAASDPDPEQRAGESVSARATRQAVLSLSPELRDTVAARFWGDIPVSEIARDAGVTPVAIRKRLKKAFALLADALEENPS
jgi:RNA polymerase sigma-70 factor (ECF subfamily)